MAVLRVSISTFQETARPGWVLFARVTEVLIKVYSAFPPFHKWGSCKEYTLSILPGLPKEE